MNEKEGYAIDYIKCMLKANNKPLIEVTPMVLETILEIIDNQAKEIKKLKNPIICGRTIDQVINILNAYDIEKEYGIEVTMENIYAIMDKLQEEINKNMKIALEDNAKGMCNLVLEYPQFNLKRRKKMTKQQFIEKIAPIVQNVNKSRGYPLYSSVVIAQACLETGYGASQLMMKANAIFGIKAGLSWRGKVYSAKTKEVYNSEPVTITDTFRAYNNLEESVNDYFNLICNNKQYSNAVHSNNFVECIHAVASGGYATDPSYASKVIQIINTFNLSKYDSTESLKEDAENQTFSYSIGKTYTTMVNLNVRYHAGLQYGIKKYSELTPDGKKHSTNKIFATLKKGTRVTCQAITFKDGNTWMKIPSGYVCAIYNNKIYVK